MFRINFRQKILIFFKKTCFLFCEIFLPYIIFLHPCLQSVCCDSDQHISAHVRCTQEKKSRFGRDRFECDRINTFL